MQLDAFIRDRKLTDDSFAALLGPDVSAWAVRKWRYGQRIPRIGMQQRIAAATKNQVAPNDFVEAVLASERRRAEAASKGSTVENAGAAA